MWSSCKNSPIILIISRKKEKRKKKNAQDVRLEPISPSFGATWWRCGDPPVKIHGGNDV